MSDRGPQAQKGGRGLRGWLLIVVAVVLALFFVLNLQKVEVSLIVAKVQMPLVFALAIAALLGALVGWALPRLRSSRSV